MTDNSSKEIIRLAPQEGPQTAFLGSNADICIFGGSAGGGKTHALLLSPLRYINTIDFNCVIFRKTSPQIRNTGGLWDASLNIYRDLKGKPIESRLLWKFSIDERKNSEIKFAHMEYEKDRYNFDGTEVCMLCFDELQHFSEIQFFYMLSRNRSTCGIKPCVRATCNPDSESWLRNFIDWWIGDDGLPLQNRSGVVRYFRRIDGEIIWADSKNELLKHNTEFVQQYEEIRSDYQKLKKNLNNKKEIKELKEEYTLKIYKLKNVALEGIKSCTFIASSVYDNKILLETNPNYLANLKALPLVERERLLNGNWNIKPETGKFFNRDWFDIVEPKEIPQKGREVRFWDFAATKPSAKNKDPDYTVGIKIRKIENNYFIIDVIRVRENPAELEKLFLNTCRADKFVADDLGIHYSVRWEEEGGASGKQESYRLQSLLAGFDCKGIKSTKNKETRAKPLAVQAEIGNVKLQKADWNNALLSELHMFADTTTKHDDQVDGCSGAFNALTSVYIHPTMPEENKPKNEEELIAKRIENYEQMEEDFLSGEDIFE